MKLFLSLLLLSSFVVFSWASVSYKWQLEVANNSSSPNSTDRYPSQRYHHYVALETNETVFVFGGYDFGGPYKGQFLNDTWTFNLTSKKWHEHFHRWNASTPLKRAYGVALTYKKSDNHSEIIVYGGAGGSEYLSDVWRYHNRTWSQDIFTSPSEYFLLGGRTYHAADIVDDVMYVFGGHIQLYDTTNSLLAYNLTAKNWTVLQKDDIRVVNYRPSGRLGASLNYFKDPKLGKTLILFGGFSEYSQVEGFNDTWQYIISNNSWIKFVNSTNNSTYNSTVVPPARYSHEAVLLNETLYIYGGLASHRYTTNPPVPQYDVYFGDVWALSLAGSNFGKWERVVESSAPGKRQGHMAINRNETLLSVGGYVEGVGLTNDIWTFHVSKTNSTSNSSVTEY